MSTMLEAGSTKGHRTRARVARLCRIRAGPRQRPGMATAADVWTKEQVHTFAAKTKDDRLYAHSYWRRTGCAARRRAGCAGPIST
ncbi:hypothetical protein ACFYT3_21560 [Nocardia amikacinitolerans]|uniref:hypothetical protein n=1 Tax=Nocardia amikacinitolerans TaxID=756689 RepID=UPI00369DB9E3